MTGAQRGVEPTGTLAEALGHVVRLMQDAPALAAEQAAAILEVVPSHVEATLLQYRAFRLSGQPRAAMAGLSDLVRREPRNPLVHMELAKAALACGDEQAAVASLERAGRLTPMCVEAWILLGDIHQARGERERASRARRFGIRAAQHDAELVEAACALMDQHLDVAERALRQRLKRLPHDVAAIRMFAELAARLGRYEDATLLLEDCLEIYPDFDAARGTLVQVLQRQGRASEALAQAESLALKHPHHSGWRLLIASSLVAIGQFHKAADLYRVCLTENPRNARNWISLGHVLKTLGEQAEAIAAYRKAIELEPHLGEAWWSLANLKAVNFSEVDVEAMSIQATRTGLSETDKLHFEFALGKANEDAGKNAQAFRHYENGNALRKAQVYYDADKIKDQVQRTIDLVRTQRVLTEGGTGCAAPDPIFIIGMPRSGSTLVEQILASHSLVEGTMELPDIISIARRLGRQSKSESYPELIASLTPDEARQLGLEYLDRVRPQRQTDAPYFIDKMPNNWMHLALIHRILPNAKIIDARRHPLACSWSLYRQHFARGQGFSYDLNDIAKYYRSYNDLMNAFDTAYPGYVYRVLYERMVNDTDEQIRLLLDFVGLPFENSCLNYWRTYRAVRTASSEQVRRPIFRDGLEHWKKFEPFLHSVKTGLNDLIAQYEKQNGVFRNRVGDSDTS